MTQPMSRLDGLIPEELKPRTRRVALHGLSVPVDIGFHEFEVGNPRRVLVDIEVWRDEAHLAATDEVAAAWNYDALRTIVLETLHDRRFNLQETVVREVYQRVAARKGVVRLRVGSRKPDVYDDAESVGVELSSF